MAADMVAAAAASVPLLAALCDLGDLGGLADLPANLAWSMTRRGHCRMPLSVLPILGSMAPGWISPLIEDIKPRTLLISITFWWFPSSTVQTLLIKLSSTVSSWPPGGGIRSILSKILVARRL